MRTILGLMVVIALGFGVWFFLFKDKYDKISDKEQPLNVSKHTTEFNKSVDAVVDNYIILKEAFVNADTSQIKQDVKKLSGAIDSMKIDELKNDSSGIFQSAQILITDIKTNAEAITNEKDITEMRQDFRMISENLFPFLKTIGYHGKKLYWQNCPMAFGEDKDANWLSSTEKIVNPYMGKNHPEFKGTMLHCGLIKDTIQ